MGEAKRRKQLDKKFGDDLSKRFSIGISTVTGNFLVMVDEKFCYDSAIKRPDAEKILSQLIVCARKHKLPYKLTENTFIEWVRKTSTKAAGQIETFESVALDVRTGNHQIVDPQDLPLSVPIVEMIQL